MAENNLGSLHYSLTVDLDAGTQAKLQKQLDQINIVSKGVSSAIGVDFSNASQMAEKTINEIKAKIKSLEAYKGTLNIGDVGNTQIQIDQLKNVLKQIEKPVEINLTMSDISKMSEATLTDIQAKIKALQTYKGTIDIVDTEEIQNVNQLISGLKEVSKAVNEQNIGVQQQENTYEEIVRLVQQSTGASSEKAEQIVREQMALAELKNQRELLNQAEKAGAVSTEQSIKLRGEIAEKEILHRNALSEVTKEIKNEITAQKSEAGSVNEMQSRVNELTLAWNRLSKAKREGIEGQTIKKEVDTLKAQLNVAYAGVNRVANGMYGLNYSIQQVARELPNIAISPQMFIMAISNNLPILQDELRKTRLQNEALKLSGQATIPVWKQIISSIFSWQTALVALITVGTVFGKQIFEWIGGLLDGKNALDAATIAQDNFTKSMKEASKAAQDEVTKLKILFLTARDGAKTYEERAAAASDLIKKYPELLANYTQEQIMADKLATTYALLRKNIIDKNTAEQNIKQITENYKELAKQEELLRKGGSWWGRMTRSFQEYSVFPILPVTDKYTKDIDTAKAKIEGLTKANNDLYKSTPENIDDPFGIKAASREYTIYSKLINEDTRDIFAKRSSYISEDTTTYEQWLRKELEIYRQNVQEKIRLENELNRIRMTSSGFDLLDNNPFYQQLKGQLDMYKDSEKAVLEIEQQLNKDPYGIKEASSDFKKYNSLINSETKKVFAERSNYISDDAKTYEAWLKKQLIKYKDNADAKIELEQELFKTQKKYNDKEIKSDQSKIDAVEKLAQFEVDLQLKKNKMIFSLMDDGIDKKKAMIKLDYEEQLETIKDQEQKLLKNLNASKGLKSTDRGYITSLSDYTEANPTDTSTGTAYQNILDQRMIADQKYVKDTERVDQDAADARKKIWDQATEAFLSDIEKETKAINKKYDDWEEDLIKQKASQEEIYEFNKLRTKELNRVQSDAAMKLSSFYQKIYGDLDEYSSQTIERLKDQVSAVIKSAKTITDNGQTMIEVSYPTDEFNEQGEQIVKTATISIEAFQKLKKAGQDVNDAFSKKNPFKALSDALGEYKEANEDVNNAQKKLNDLQESGTASAKELAQAEKDLADAQDKRTKSLSDATKAINQIGEDGQKVIQTANELVDMFESWGISISDSTKEILSGLDQMFQGLASIDLTKPFTIITGTIQALAGYGKTVGSIFGFGSNKAEKDTKRLNKITKQIEETNEAINKHLEKRIELIEEATAAEAKYLNQLSQEEIKTQQNYIIQQLDRLSGTEIFGKKGKNNDLDLDELMDMMGLTTYQEFIDWWNNGGYQELIAQGYTFTNKDDWQAIIDDWNDLTDAAEESTEAMQEAATGITFDSLKDSLDDLITSVDTTFEDISDSFEEHMSDAIMNMVKSSYLTDALQKWYDQFVDAASDDNLTSDEVASLQDMYNSIYKEAQDMYDTAMAAAGIDTSSSDESALSQSIQGIQESNPGLIEAYLNTIREMVIAQKIGGENLLSVAQASQHIQSQALSELQAINSNTLAMVNAFRSVMATSSSDNGSGLRVFVK